MTKNVHTDKERLSRLSHLKSEKSGELATGECWWGAAGERADPPGVRGAQAWPRGDRGEPH